MDYTDISLLPEIEDVILKKDAALFYFSAPHCNVCKVLKPKLAELLSETFPKIELYYVDIEKAPLVSGQFKIFTIPTILVYFDGREFLRKSRNIGLGELESEIHRPYSLLFED